MTKRDFLKSSAALGAVGLANFSFSAMASAKINGLNQGHDGRQYVLPPLPYGYDALEPHIDEQTMRLHHDIHHNGYVKGLNNATEQIQKAIQSGNYTLIKHWERELAFHGGGHFLHTIFWNVMGPKQGKMSAELSRYMNKSFGNADKFREYYHAASKSVEGSGWGILAYEPASDSLIIQQAEKHHNLSPHVTIPLLPVDVWEHAYYLKYQNKRGDYINGFLEVVNWDYVSEQFEKVLEAK